MDYRTADAGRIAAVLTLQAGIVAGLVFLTLHLLLTTHYYATALLLVGVAVMVALGMTQVIGRVIRLATRDLERLVAEGGGRPGAAAGGTGGSPLPIDRAALALSAARTERQQQLDYLQALLDTVRVILVVVAVDGRVTLANRAARTFAARNVSGLEQLAALGPSVARRLLGLKGGAREVVTLADGNQIFVSVSEFMATGHEPQRLFALQSIAGELDAVELKAWQEMAHVLAHEMMNSLTPIASLSESLESLLTGAVDGNRTTVATNPEVAGELEAIKRRSRGLMDFVERYRTFADLPTPRLERITLGTLLRGIELLLAPEFAARQIAYRMSISPEDLAVEADPQLLEQALINLLRNATDAVAGLAERRIDLTCRVDEGWVLLEVADTGCGVAQERSQVFVPFYTTKPGGSGIGLSLARKIALSHRGRLDLRANHPQGAVFTLALPALAPG